MYQESELVRIAKRENNSKRSYLVVNPLQGKHMAADPGAALALFRALADTVKQSCQGKRTLVIGFAETATAIGAAVAVELGAYYLQTTREHIEGAGYLYFSEEHSHASQQKLVKNQLDEVMPSIDRVLFAEDELTTGKTILNLVNLMQREYPGRTEYAAASLLNGMDDAARAVYQSRGIGIYYLAGINHASYEMKLQQYSQKGDYISWMPGRQSLEADSGAGEKGAQEFEIRGWMDARQLVSATAYEKACEKLCQEIHRMLQEKLSGRVLVLGTEEFMYPALLAAQSLSGPGVKTWFHATTRSPIAVFREPCYPLHIRHELPGIYDKNRRTFVYDTGSYDAAVIITDSHSREREGMDALVRAVSGGTENVYTVWWK